MVPQIGHQQDADGTLYAGIASKELTQLRADNALLQQGCQDLTAQRVRMQATIDRLNMELVYARRAVQTPDAQEIADLRTLVTTLAGEEAGGVIRLSARMVRVLQQAARQIEVRREMTQ